ncbi:WS/DGAT domain-containing protein [Rhodococcus sp. SORGH_AS_0301]|uniref:WS/DGAT domain-containing protein n=1 Tax=Rhodococcus sp. SORGH_AS_0301 TaxID=3041780 RepID=UPI002788CE7E|nr:WS/DGAT domain-containing protein [Rhodococcus sp. SORGH_AS_0301]MDQ1181025.1 hypothetical protein [Rhodococcus sp. SORGH_AS_0301]
MTGRLTATDARMYWLSRRLPSDQFLLYAFDGVLDDPDAVATALVRRARAVGGLSVRLRETRWTADYPYWVPTEVTRDRVRVHAGGMWQDCLDRVAETFGDQVEPRREPWRVHLYPCVDGVPGTTGSATVLVLQIAHALGDGGRVSALARALLSDELSAAVRTVVVSAPLAVARGAVELPARVIGMVRRAREAVVADRRRTADTAAGVIPGPPLPRAPTLLSRPAGGTTRIRCVVCPASDLRTDTVSVTVAALVVVSDAMSRHLASLGEPVPDDLGAEVMIAIPGESRTTAAANAFHNAGVDLHPSVQDLRARARAIDDSLQDRRRRLEHPAFGVGDRATETVPAVIVRRDVDRADLSVAPTTVAGHTVVSSVNRGVADLTLSGRPVVLSAGFPALSPTVGVTHGVHGIGDVVTLSIVTSDDVMDADAYTDCLREAVDRVREALR